MNGTKVTTPREVFSSLGRNKTFSLICVNILDLPQDVSDKIFNDYLKEELDLDMNLNS